MEIKVFTNISSEFENIEVHIHSPEMNEDVLAIEKLLKGSINSFEEIIGYQDNNIFIIKLKDIIKFYGKEKNNYCETKEGTFLVKETLSYLEENLPPKDFLRISNSVIININFVKCFNNSIIGKLIVKLKNDDEEIVSRRRTSEILKFLKDRRK